MFTVPSLLLSFVLCSGTLAQTYLPSNVPAQTKPGQSGTNQCGTGNNQTSLCQNAYINSVDDFCLFGPPEPGPNSLLGNVERSTVAYCTKTGYGSRLIPDGTIKGAHFIVTPDFVQVTGVGDMTKINVPAGDGGGELDPHGADELGNPMGGVVFSSAFGEVQQLAEWSIFLSSEQFCMRACKPGPSAVQWCQHIYDIMGCNWNMPGNYLPGSFEKCAADSGEPMGIYGTSTWARAASPTPSAHPPPATSSCTTVATISNGFGVTSSSATPSPTSTSATLTRVAAAATATTEAPSTTARPTPSVGAAPSNVNIAGSMISLSLLAFGSVMILF